MRDAIDYRARQPVVRTGVWHVTSGVTACILSLVIHVAAFLLLSEQRFEIAAISRVVSRLRQAKAMKLDKVSRETPASETRRAAIDAEKVAPETDLTETLDVLRIQPDNVVIEPPRFASSEPVGESAALAPPDTSIRAQAWEPRQEIMAIEKRMVADELSILPRRHIPRIERVPGAPDVVSPVDEKMIEDSAAAASPPAGALSPGNAETVRWPLRAPMMADTDLAVGDFETAVGAKLFQENARGITAFKPIEKLLMADITTYAGPRDAKYGYFRLLIKRAGDDVLPTIPKDVVLVQDCSASMAEQRLHFCADGLHRCITRIGPDDRFNVVAFKEKSFMCFDDWSAPTPEALSRANGFIEAMKPGGNTDIFSSIRDIMALPRIEGRPLLALLITDGCPTVGLTAASDIIGEFTKLNKGAISVFTMGTLKTANSYLLDFLSYCNRGDALIVTRGRWDIPDCIERIMSEVSRPVLTGIAFRFMGASCEVYPAQTSNLYLDRPLVLHGRYPAHTEKIVFQAVGKAGSADCDMIFELSLAQARKSGDDSIKSEWARQKIYHLIGSYTRVPSPATLKEISETTDGYRVSVPYRKYLQD